MAASKGKKKSVRKPARKAAKKVAAKKEVSPQAQLESFIDAFDAKDQKLIRTLRAFARKRLPGVNELVYDYNAFFVLGYSPTDYGPDGILSIAARANDVRLYMMHATELPDPKKLLIGKGTQARYVEIKTGNELKDPDVAALIESSIGLSKIKLPAKGYIEIRSVQAKPPNRKKPNRKKK